jgi:hypothetical protein
MECELLISAEEQHPRDSGALGHYGDVFDVLACEGFAPAGDAKERRLRRRGKVSTAVKITMSARPAGDHIARCVRYGRCATTLISNCIP